MDAPDPNLLRDFRADSRSQSRSKSEDGGRSSLANSSPFEPASSSVPLSSSLQQDSPRLHTYFIPSFVVDPLDPSFNRVHLLLSLHARAEATASAAGSFYEKVIKPYLVKKEIVPVALHELFQSLLADFSSSATELASAVHHQIALRQAGANRSTSRLSSKSGIESHPVSASAVHLEKKFQKYLTLDIGSTFDIRPTLFVRKNFKNKTKNGSNC